tara:strand:- start:554 stop:955 length:402 start_codon:yes stop_codon:yes gene_type:complete
MKEIKFRAWDKVNQTMSNVNDIVGLDRDDDSEFKYIYTDDYGKDVKDWKNIELMQYTGLKDKNGKEIYEGDIIALYGFKQKEEKEIEKDVVRWNEEEASFWVGCAKSYDQDNPKILTNILIVGNIYETPELQS